MDARKATFVVTSIIGYAVDGPEVELVEARRVVADVVVP